MTRRRATKQPELVDDCVFCEIVRGEAPAEIVWEGDRALAFVPLDPVTPGHALVIPKVHVANALMRPALTADVFGSAAYYANIVKDCSGVNLITSAGESATQSVFHLHVHVVPRRENDGLRLPWTGQGHLHGADCVRTLSGGAIELRCEFGR